MKILNELGFPNLKTDMQYSDIETQSELNNTQIEFPRALRKALGSFLFDSSAVESPLSIIESIHTVSVPREKLTELLNADDSKLRLLGIDESPEFGESVDEFWIFSLSIPQLSDHAFTALIDRDDLQPARNYGFN